ncbi:ubiquinol cytochrome C oxidoreductase [uncultured Shimia sp.]|uniref:ubiquinol cytochrome C oxidoreductase n=1 Tax=uncultured Shimia sp. TaxID=573152 RepID=UPI002630BC2D|nr:ubiquinol cytochrome C oxidoreductase [uncultured Shimia sp.]
MINKNNALYYLTAGWLFATVATGLYYLAGSTAPSTDVTAQTNPNLHHISVIDMAPGDTAFSGFNGKPVVIWRRSLPQMATALTQWDPRFAYDDILESLQDGSLEADMDPEQYTYLEWLVLSPVDMGGIGCVTLANAGDFGGFFDPCRGSHFDLWGRVKKGPSEHDLQVVPTRFDDNRHSVLIDLTDIQKFR